MRIDKRVRCILKQKIDTMLLVSDRDDYAAQTFDGWFKGLVHEVLGEPAVDAIYASYGLVAADEIEGLWFGGDLSEYVEGTYQESKAKTRLFGKPAAEGGEAGKTAMISIDVPLKFYESGEARNKVKLSLIHEIEHVARHTAGLLGKPPYAGKTGLARHTASLEDPQEHAAIKAEMLALINLGLTDHQIVTEQVDDYFVTGSDEAELSWEMQVLAQEVEAMMIRLLAEAKEDYADFITV